MQTPAPATPPPRSPAPRKGADAKRPGVASTSRSALAVLLAGVAMTAAAFAWALAREGSAVEDDLARRASSVVTSLQREVTYRTDLLAALGAYVRVTRAESRTDLRGFVGDLVRRQPGTATLDWAPRVTPEAVKPFEERQWLQGLPDYRVHRGGDALPPSGDVYPLLFGIGAGSRAAGLDLTPGSDLAAIPDVAPALATARTLRGPAATAPVRLSRPDAERPAALFVAPVFAAGATPDADADLLGFALGLFDVEAIGRDAITEGDRPALGVEIRDSASTPGSAPLLSLKAPRDEAAGPLMALWNLAGGATTARPASIDVGGRKWNVAIEAGPRLVAQHVSWVPWFLALAGLGLSVAAATAASGYRARGAGLASMRRRLASERRESMEKVSRLTDELEREKLDRRRTEESLFREKQQFRLMFNAVPAMICYKDTKNRFLLVNEAAAAAMGRSVDEMEGKPCSEIVPARAYELYRDDLEIIQTGKPKLGLLEEVQLPSGRTVWMRTDKLPEYDSMGRVVGILVFSQDITEHRNAEAEIRRLNEELENRVSARTSELRAANQELESFAYSVSHDLRTPLRTIDGFSKLLVEEHSDDLPQSARDYLKRLRGAAQRMGHLIDDLLRLTRVSRSEIHREQVDLSALARQAAEELRLAHPERRVDVIVEATPFATGDSALLANVIQNLMSNAWKFTSQAKEARIEFGSRTVSGDRTAWYVRDNGVGFDMVYADKLFGAFQRLHSQEQYEGSGIGLATVALVIRRHAGEVWAESVPDHGATFYFTLGS